MFTHKLKYVLNAVSPFSDTEHSQVLSENKVSTGGGATREGDKFLNALSLHFLFNFFLHIVHIHIQYCIGEL